MRPHFDPDGPVRSVNKVIVYADGGSRGNPGKAGYGAVVLAESGDVLAERCEYIGEATNNVAEYRGLIAGLKAATDIAPGANIVARLDSKLVVEQMSGRWKIKHPAMAELAKEARGLADTVAVTYEWVPRNDNAHADRLANEAMDGEGAADKTADSEPTRTSGSLSTEQPAEAGAESATASQSAVTVVPLPGCAGAVTPAQTWAALQNMPKAYLVDVRTQAEWTFVGVPRTPEQVEDTIFIEWVRFPSGRPNADFGQQLAQAIAGLDYPIFFICRSGARSAAAAIAATEQGYTQAYNVQQGFEGDLSGEGHRNINGWRHAGLPWQQR